MSLKINNLTTKVEDKTILNDFNLSIKDGEIHTIMGPNGVGKSTLAKTIMGSSDYKVLDGSIVFNNTDITNMKTDERSRLGIFLSMQNPIEIDGVSNQDLLRSAVSVHENKSIGLYEFIKKSEEAMQDLSMDKSLMHRSFNVGFSGGERKKNEVLQIKLLKPKFIILDELDSGLDVDSLRIVSSNIRKYLDDNKDVSVLIITHYPRILEYLKPDYVHILFNGNIVLSDDYKLAIEIEKNGYKNIVSKANNVTEDTNNE